MDLKKIYKLAYNCTPFDGTMKNYGDFVTTMFVAPCVEKIQKNETDRITFPELYLYLLIKSGISFDFMANTFHEMFKSKAILNEKEDIEVENQDIDYDLYDLCGGNKLFEEINKVGKVSPTMFTTITDLVYEKPSNNIFDLFAFWQDLYDRDFDFGFRKSLNQPKNDLDEKYHKLLIKLIDDAYTLNDTYNEVLFANTFAQNNEIDVETIQIAILFELEDSKNPKLNEIKAKYRNLFKNIDLTSELPSSNMDEFPVNEQDVKPEPNLVEKTSSRFTIKSKLSNLSSLVIGQDKATNEVANTLISASVFKPLKHPTASFILTGPTGVGKTETAKAVANLLYENKIVTVDMTQFHHPSDINRLTGSAAGYVGYDDANPFLEFLKKNEPGVILFDEIEKAHSNCLNLIMRILDEGEFIDAKGNIYDLSNKVVFCTTNVTQGVSSMKGIGFGATQASTSERLTEIAGIKPEIIGRFDSKIEYEKLSHEACEKIACKIIEDEIAKFMENEENENITINYTNDLIEKILKESNTDLLGARDIKMNVRNFFKLPVANYIIENEPSECCITVSANGVKETKKYKHEAATSKSNTI